MSTSPPRRTLSVLNSIHIVPSSKKKENSDAVSLNFTHDIYSFFLLLHAVPFETPHAQAQSSSGQHKNDDIDGETLFSRLPADDQLKIKCFTLFSFIVQMLGILYFAFNFGDYSFIKRSQPFLYNCEPYIAAGNQQTATHPDARPAVNGTAIDDQRCDMIEDTYYRWQSFEPQIAIAKYIALFMTVIYQISDILSIPKLIILALKSQNNPKLRTLTIILSLSQIVIFLTIFLRIFQIIINQDAVIDVLTVGISFIILGEIDNKCYDYVSDLNVYGTSLFDVSIDRCKLSDTIYKYVTPSKLDCYLLMCTVFFVLIISTIFIFDRREVIGFYTRFLLPTGLYIVLLLSISCISLCKRCRSK